MDNSSPSRVSAFSSGAPSNAPKRVGTHNGSFHCDEALGCFMIRLTNRFRGAEIVRSRAVEPKVLETLDAVLDVGGVYDPSRGRYDHHQKGFEEVFGHGFTTKLSSAGLVYKHFGLEIIAKEIQLDEGHPDMQRLYLAVYKSFTEAIDAIDNGINQYDTEQPPKYVNNTHLSSRVGRFNLHWIEPDQTSEKENEAFQRAMALAGSEFLDAIFLLEELNIVRFHAKSWLPARSIVMECLAARQRVDPSGEIMVLDRFCPWQLHLFELEQEMQMESSIKYVLYQALRGRLGGLEHGVLIGLEEESSARRPRKVESGVLFRLKEREWRVQAVAVAADRFKSRKALPSKWRGLRYDKLSEEAGIPCCVFVHISGFVGGNQSFDGALAKGALTI